MIKILAYKIRVYSKFLRNIGSLVRKKNEIIKGDVRKYLVFVKIGFGFGFVGTKRETQRETLDSTSSRPS